MRGVQPGSLTLKERFRKEWFDEQECNRFVAADINLQGSTHFQRRSKQMVSDLDNATEQLAQAEERLADRLSSFCDLEARFAEQSKKASGNIRDATQKLADGLAKLEKSANFDRLERLTVLLERAAEAMTTLAELEQSGRLGRISAAIK